MKLELINNSRDIPNFIFNDKNSSLNIKGSSYSNNIHPHYEQVESFIKEYNSEKLVLNFNLYYYNTASSKYIFNMMKSAKENQNIKKLYINWNYDEEDDYTIYDIEYYGKLIKHRINFLINEK